MGCNCSRDCCCRKLNLKTAILKQTRLLIWIAGGPCSGKTTQSQLLCDKFHFAYICPEAIIRQCLYQVNQRIPNIRLERLHQHRIRIYNAVKIHESFGEEEREFLNSDIGHHKNINQLFAQRRQSDSEEEDDEYGPKLVKEIQKSIRLGKPIDPWIITALIFDVMDSSLGSYNGFVVDGYPRDFDQATMFDNEIGEPHLVFHLTCPEEVMHDRIVRRAEQRQRCDENEFTIPFKFERYRSLTEPLLDFKREELGDGQKFLSIFGDREVNDIAAHIRDDVKRFMGKWFKLKIVTAPMSTAKQSEGRKTMRKTLRAAATLARMSRLSRRKKIESHY